MSVLINTLVLIARTNMCEHFKQFEAKERPVKALNTSSIEEINYKHEKTQEKIDQIRDQEQIQQIQDFIATNRQVLNQLSVNDVVLLDLLKRHIEEMSAFDQSYNIWDETPDALLPSLESYHKNKLSSQKQEALKEVKNTGAKLENFVISQQQAGHTNTEIIQTILEKEKEGQIHLPPLKKKQYQNFLQLSQLPTNQSDKDTINAMMNSNANLLLDEGSFENVLFQIFEEPSISDITKRQIQKQFKISPINTGGDLRNALEKRNDIIEQHENKLNVALIDLSQLDNQEATLQQKRDKLQDQLMFETNFTKREQLDKQRQLIINQLQELYQQRTVIQGNYDTLKQTIPSKSLSLRGYQAKLDNKTIYIQSPINQYSIKIPIETNNKGIGEVANTLFLYKIIDKMDASKILFPEEKFTQDHLPSNTMIRFSNEILAALNLEHSGTILSPQNLSLLEKQLLRLQNPQNKQYIEEPSQAMEEDLKQLNLIESGVLIKHKLIEILETLHRSADINLFPL